MSTDDNQNPQQPNQNNTAVTSTKPKSNRGRKTGYRKPQPLVNGVVSSERIFEFIDKETIPVSALPRFLKICDTWINDLGAESLKDTDIEEVALYARDRIYMDGIYKGFAEADTIDPNLITQIEKMNKGMEARKENLGARFKDRGDKRKDKSGFSFLDLFEKFEAGLDVHLKEAIELKTKIESNKSNYTSNKDYMEGHAPKNVDPTLKEEE